MGTKTIETRQISNSAIEYLEKQTPESLEKKHRDGDYLFFGGILFKMVYYSLESIEGGQSKDVVYWSELYDLEIDLDFKEKTVITNTPIIDWRKQGF